MEKSGEVRSLTGQAYYTLAEDNSLVEPFMLSADTACAFCEPINPLINKVDRLAFFSDKVDSSGIVNQN